MKNGIFLIITLLILLSTACQRENMDNIVITEPTFDPPPEVELIGSLSGLIVNNDGDPVSSADIIIGDETTTTDINGQFIFENKDLNENGTLIQINHPDYFTGFKRFYAFANELNQIEHRLTEKRQINTFTPELGVTIQLLGAKIRIPSGPYLDQEGQTIQEPVIAQVDFIPPNENDLGSTVSGDLTGYNLNNERVCIHSLGLVFIEIESTTGIDVNLNADKLIEVEFPDPGSVNQDLSYWTWNKELTQWFEQEPVTVESNTLSFTTNHVGNLMIGYSSPALRIEGQLVSMGSNFANSRMVIKDQSAFFSQQLRPTNSGSFASMIPAFEEQQIDIKHECAVSNQHHTIEPQTEAAILDPIPVSNQEANILITGVTTQCDGSEAPFSQMLLELGEEFLMAKTDQNGVSNYSFASCEEAAIGITMINEQTQFASETLNLQISGDIQIGNLEQCVPIQAGYDINYNGFNWEQELNNTIVHSWDISTIEGPSVKYIYSTKMEDIITGALYSCGVYVFTEGNTKADFSITFPTQGFSAQGTCDLSTIKHANINSHRFTNFQGTIDVTDQTLYPGNVDSLIMDVVYYD